jgi:hypothetical protein
MEQLFTIQEINPLEHEDVRMSEIEPAKKSRRLRSRCEAIG